MNRLKFTVAIVTYNVATHIKKTLDSIRSQTYDNIELIIIDGNSTDSTVQIINDNIDIVSYFKSEPDKGIYDAMNKAFKAANGDFIIFLGAGDTFYDTHVLKKVASCISDLGSIHYGDVILSQLNKKYWGKFIKIKFGIGNICHQAIFYPRCVYMHHSYNLLYKVYADYEFNLRMYGSYKFIYMNIVIAYYDLNGFSSYTKDFEFEKVRKKLIIHKLGVFPYYIGKLYHFLHNYKNQLKSKYQ